MPDRAPDPAAGYGAARVALIALRAATLGGTATDPAVVRLDPAPALQSTDAVARALAALPKPVRVSAEVRDGVLVVQWAPLPPPEPPLPLYGPLEAGVIRMTDHPELSALGFLFERHGPAIARLGVACVGAGDAVRVTVAEVWAWQRDYQVRMPPGLLGGVSYAMGALDGRPRPEGLEGAPAAVVDGAAAYVEFRPMDEDPVQLWLLDPAAAPPMVCEDCGRRTATTRTRDRELGYWRERHQCGLCGLTDDAEPGVVGEWPDPEDVEAWERAPDADFLAFFAAYCVRYQERTGVPLPWHIAAFVARHPPREE